MWSFRIINLQAPFQLELATMKQYNLLMMIKYTPKLILPDIAFAHHSNIHNYTSQTPNPNGVT